MKVYQQCSPGLGLLGVLRVLGRGWKEVLLIHLHLGRLGARHLYEMQAEISRRMRIPKCAMHRVCLLQMGRA